MSASILLKMPSTDLENKKIKIQCPRHYFIKVAEVYLYTTPGV